MNKLKSYRPLQNFWTKNSRGWVGGGLVWKFYKLTEAQWRIGMSSASYTWTKAVQVLCICTSEWGLRTLFAGQNHLFLH